MTKKHFKALATILYSEGAFTRDMDNDEARSTPSAEDVLRRVTYRIADYCATENPLFNREKFIRAAGLHTDQPALTQVGQ